MRLTRDREKLVAQVDVVATAAFHGRTYGALSATPQEAKQVPFAPLVPGFRAVPATQIAGAVDEQTAAVLIEPIQGESGVLEIPAEVLADIRAACDDAGAALIFDEVQTGMGRTGTLFAYEQFGVVPDAMTLAKGLGVGLSVEPAPPPAGWRLHSFSPRPGFIAALAHS